MTDREHEFWTSGHKYEDLAREYERNIEITHPEYITSKGMCPCLKWFSYCGWANTEVKYYEYRGERI